MDATFSIALPRQAYTVAVVRDFVSEILRLNGVCASCVDDILLAVSEACANAIDHGAPAREYVVELHLHANSCLLWVSHPGHAPNRRADERFSADNVALPGLEAESGRGIPLMNRLMDDVAFTGAPRTTVRLRKQITHHCDEAPAPRPRVPAMRLAAA